MKASLNFLTVGVLIALAACSTQEVKRDTQLLPPWFRRPPPNRTKRRLPAKTPP